MVNLLIAAALAAASPVAAPPAPPQPAMYVIRDADTTIYLFGTFHALDPHTDWFSPEIRDAFERSNELVLETLVPEGPTVVGGRPGLPIRRPSVAPSASFLATAKLAIDAGQAQGMQVSNGADMVLRHVAEAEGKPVEGLETLEFQLNMFNSMPATAAAPQPQPAAMPASDAPQDLPHTMAEMQSAWRSGDQNMFVRMLAQLRTASPDTYRVMFTERNARWADWIAARMRSPGTVFVAVGAGHLAGKDSVLVRLAEKGLESTRVD